MVEKEGEKGGVHEAFLAFLKAMMSTADSDQSPAGKAEEARRLVELGGFDYGEMGVRMKEVLFLAMDMSMNSAEVVEALLRIKNFDVARVGQSLRGACGWTDPWDFSGAWHAASVQSVP